MTPIRWFQSLFSRSIHQPRRRRTAERLTPSRLDVLEKRVLLSATELIVTTNQDVTSSTDGLITLREALAFAASNPGDDTITFGNGSAIAGGTNFTDATADTIMLGGTELTINSNVTLDGPGAALLSISGNNASRVFSVNFTITAAIRDVTITGGNFSGVGGGGGGIFNVGRLMVSHCTISGNTADNVGGGISNVGSLTVSRSTISGNASSYGGGIYSNNTLAVSHSTISGNTAGSEGGGISINGTLTVSHSTISGNTAGSEGGGIVNFRGPTTIVNSTLVNNRADSDGDNGGTGGGIGTYDDNSTSTTLHNTIIAGNFVGTGTTANDVASKPLEAASRNNLIGDSGSAGGLTYGTNGNIVGALVADIFETGVLANNGGPTQTIAIKLGGPAVNAGDNASVPADTLDLDGDLNTTEPVPFDQRGAGFARIVDTTVDIGAFELLNLAPTAVGASPNPASLVESTNTSTRIKVADITITDDGLGTNVLSLSGADAGDFEIDGLELFLKADTVLNVVAQPAYSVTIEVNDASIGGTPDASVNFTLNITEVPSLVVTTNSDIVDDNDGLTSLREAITFANSNPDASTITFGNGTSVGGTNFTDATADTIVLTGGEMALTTSLTIAGNSAANTIIDGGWDGVDNSGIGSRIFLVDDGTATVQTVMITGLTLRKAYNRPANYQLLGGAIRNLEHLTLSDSVLRDNYSWNGGGVLNFGGTLISSRNTFTGNQGDQGGAVFNAEGTFVSTGDAFTSNVADIGGAIASYYGSSSTSSATVINGTIANNIASFGGGIFNQNNLTTINVTIANNSAASGAGLFAQISSVWNARNTILAGNPGEDYYRHGAAVVVADRLLVGDNTLTGTGITSNVTYAAIFGTNVLANNGGPTQTIALKSGGAAVNAGSNSLAVDDNSQPLTNDQRGTGFARIIGGIVDIGAYERANSTPADVTLSSNTIAENAGADVVIGTLAGVDPDPNDALTLSLPTGLTDNALFSLDGNNLRANASFDFEAKSSYTVTVRVTDFEGTTYEKPLTVNIINLLDTTADADAFVVTYSQSEVSITHSVNGGVASSLGAFPLNVPITLDGLDTNDTVRVIGTSGDDLFVVNGAGITINGAELILNGPASRTLIGELGNDTYSFDADELLGHFTLDESAGGVDTISFAETSTVNVVFSLAVAETQIIDAGNLSLSLGSSTKFENITGGRGNDTLTGNGRDNTLNGGPGNDRLNGGAGNDVLIGGINDDTYVFGVAVPGEADEIQELLNGGIDTLNFAPQTTSVTLNLWDAEAQTVHTNRTLKLNSGRTIENVIGGSGDDRITGNRLNNTLTGGAGQDTLNGSSGDDILAGGPGNDTYFFVEALEPEADRVNESVGQGADSLRFASLSVDLVLNLGTSLVQTVHTNRTLKLNSASTLENAVGGTGSDTLIGNALNNRLWGIDGSDVLVGLAGDDSLFGGTGRDLLIGGLGADTLDGGNDDDILIAGRTVIDTSIVRLDTLRTEWISANRYEERITNLRAGVGSPVVSLQATINVLNDANEIDTLTGGTAFDWYFRAVDDVITDLFAGAVADLL